MPIVATEPEIINDTALFAVSSLVHIKGKLYKAHIDYIRVPANEVANLHQGDDYTHLMTINSK